ncbi:AI-2E family transporter [Halomarina rubra]|uniref:AI-2E family transporter n=1 Tax=Halomarina rubra TaxID=2071873 RepID=A0ABD6AU10_9EURY|nr:AI-2E family transporter [Halomarina rubra]
MHLARRRRNVVAGLLALFALCAAYVLWEVIGTVFFAITVAYVLVPARNRLVARGFSRRVASALVTTGAFAVVLFVLGAFGFLLYQRRQSAFTLIESLPDELSLEVAGMVYAVELSTVVGAVTATLRGVATGLAATLPVVLLKLMLFAILLFGLLLRPGATGDAFRRVVPDAYHDVLIALNERIRQTLYGIYVLQAATAFGTALVALVVFYALGYEAVFTLAIVAGFLQFIPVLGPSVLIALLALVDLVGPTPDPTRAALVVVVGGVLIGAVPDAVIRPRLASWAADLPTSLYFIGFVGGVLTVGAIGFIAGPLVVALVVETVELLANDTGSASEADADDVGPSVEDDTDAPPEADDPPDTGDSPSESADGGSSPSDSDSSGRDQSGTDPTGD